MQVNLQRVVMRIRTVIREVKAIVTKEIHVQISTVAIDSCQSWQEAGIRKIGFLAVALMAILAAYIRDTQHRLSAQLLLNAKAELIASGLLVVIHVKTGKARRQNRQGGGTDRSPAADAKSRV